ncbi:glycosyltransferase [Amylibacter sp.]|nr:glycosyltransferase [Amylibacter sp.]
MRICLVIPSFYPATNYGGPIISSYHASMCLSQSEGCEMYISTSDANLNETLDVVTNQYIRLDGNINVKYYKENIREVFSLSLFFNIWRDIISSDIVHVQAIFNYSTPIALFWAWIFSKRVVLTPRGCLGYWALSKKKLAKKLWLFLFLRPFSKNVVWHATSNQEKTEILNIFYGVDVKVIPNGVDVGEYSSPTITSRMDLIQKYTGKSEPVVDKLVVSVGRLHKKKGFDILINSIKELMKQYPSTHLLIAGPDGGERDELISLIKKLSIKDNVHLIGEVVGKDKVDLYANADVFALPSHNENYGNVYIESLAAGTPIVASRNTPWSEIEQNYCGKWVSNDIGSFTNAIKEIFECDRDLMRAKCLEFALKNDWKNVAKDLKVLYKSLIFR